VVSSSGEEGTTLVEVMMALMVITLVMVGGLSVIIGSMSHVAAAGQQQRAITLMNQQMEQVRALAPATIGSYSAPAATTINGTTYSYSFNSAAGGTGYEWVQVTVAWSNSAQAGIPAQVTDQELLCNVSSC
jgi:Tfp pilus assembly protein PilV